MNRKERRAAATTSAGISPSRTGSAVGRSETLFQQALQAHQAGRLPDAEAFYRNVLALAPRHAGALNYFGVLHHQTGRNEAAIELIRQAIATDRNNAEPRYSLGLIHASLGRDADAIVQNQKALKLNPRHAGARTNLGLLLLRQGRTREATDHLTQALALTPSQPAYENLAQALLQEGRAGEAADVVLRGLRNGDSTNLKSVFVLIARAIDPEDAAQHAGFRDALVRALTEPWCRPRDLARLCSVMLLQQPEIAAGIHRLAEAAEHDAGDATDSDDPLLHALLTTTPVVHVDLERWLTNSRRALLDRFGADPAATPNRLLGFAVALARQCFINEYVFAVSEDEQRKVDALNDAVSVQLAAGETVAPMAIVLSAAYAPLHTLAGSERLAQIDMEPLGTLIEQQIREPQMERGIRATIPALTPITDATSTAVRAQYEENPYPRWTVQATDRLPLTIDQYIRTRFPAAPYRSLDTRPIDLLIAGCGTGMHAIERVMQFRPNRTLAIDLSLSSLSYAARKSREAGLTTIEFAQADILTLPALARHFDVIDASGVLHHMGDPLEGWRALVSLLRPGGLMHIALYSAAARQEIRALRAIVTETAWAPTPAGLRALRQMIVSREPTDPLRRVADFADFFSASECRDLLMHVQEHQFSLPEIAAFIEAEGFELLGFETRAEARYHQRFPDDPSATNLANWARFESEHPATFTEMYQFWIQKRPSPAG